MTDMATMLATKPPTVTAARRARCRRRHTITAIGHTR